MRVRTSLLVAPVVAVTSLAFLLVSATEPAGANTLTNGSSVPDSVVPIGTFTSDTPFSSGQVVSVVVPANSVFASGSSIKILECADPGGVLPTTPSQCDGRTIQGDTIFAASDGSIDYTDAGPDSGYTIYALPDAFGLAEPSSSTPVCNLTDECGLYIGENQNDFGAPHFFSQGFYVSPTIDDTGVDPGDGGTSSSPGTGLTNGSTLPDSIVPIGPVTANTPYSSGQVVSVVVPTNTVFTPGDGIHIEECAAPSGEPPTTPSQCDSLTIQADTVFARSDGSIDYTDVGPDSGYTIYALPDPSIGDLGDGPVCNLTNECVLYIGENQNDFGAPHFFSQPFYVNPTPGDTGTNPGDGGSSEPAAEAPETPVAIALPVIAAGVFGGLVIVRRRRGIRRV